MQVVVLKTSSAKLTFLNLCTVAPNPIRADPMSPACSSRAMHSVHMIFSKVKLQFKGNPKTVSSSQWSPVLYDSFLLHP